LTLLNRKHRTFFTSLVLSGCSLTTLAQSATPQQAAPPVTAPVTVPAVPEQAPAQAPTPEPTQPTPHGTVLFERHSDPDTQPADSPAAAPAQPQASKETAAPDEDKLSGSALSDEQRAALTVSAYDLDARLIPASSQLEMHARLTLRNDSAAPLSRIALQISSSLTWQSATLLDAARTKLNVVQHLLETDTDHTGKANELVLDLPTPLAPGASLDLDTLYAGLISVDGTRLERIGASHDQAIAADWDAISSTATSLRGFGNVLWYPVASPQFFLGDGAKLFQAIAANRLREESASVRLRVALEYKGDPPTALYFCGLRQPLVAVSDNSDAPVAVGSGIATAEFPAATLGFRPLSLFVVEHPEVLIAASSPAGAASSSSAPAPDAEKLLAIETSDDAAIPRLADSAQSLTPFLQQWLGPHPTSALTLLDHDGQPFEDGPLLVAPMAAISSSSSTTALLHSLTHAWVQTGQPWMDEGLAQFLTLVYTEQNQSRDVANAALQDLLRPLALAEPAADILSAGTAGQPLIAASDELYYRRKAAAMWWALRSITGDQPLQIALTTWRSQAPSHDSPLAQATAFEHLIEQTSHKDLSWFFNDWVFRDRGLPDLTIAAVEPRLLEASKGHDTGWLVAITVRNEGAAAAQVPLTVRAGDVSVTRTIHINGLASTTERVVIEAKPTQILLNGGTMPELRESNHTLNVTVQGH
jgi:hypothetical protein